MKDDSTKKVWTSASTRQLAEVLADVSEVDVIQNILRDVMTEKEIIEISSRLEAAKMLRAGKKYTEVIGQTGLSSRTVARISDWMQNGCGGYEVALRLIDAHHDHIPPARA